MKLINNKTLLVSKFLSLICISTLLSSGVVFAYESKVLETKNIFSTDKVDINLTNNTKIVDENGKISIKELDSNEKIKISPGSSISIIPTIKNNGSDCYIRTNIQIDEESGLDINNFSGISDSWKFNSDDGYFYYTKILKSNEEAKFYDTLNVPYEYSKQDFDFNVTTSIDAIQSNNIEPDFSSKSPWGDIEIQKYEDKNLYQYKKVDSENDSIKITFNGKSKELITNSENLFSTMENKLLPGDSFENIIDFKNDFDKEIHIFMENKENSKVQNLSDDKIYNDLLRNISLEIKNVKDNKVVFNGDLTDSIKNIKILSLKPNEENQVSFKISFNKNADNSYANLSSLVNWYFNTSFDENDSPENGSGPKTGDYSNVYILLIISIISGSLSVYLSTKRMKKNE